MTRSQAVNFLLTEPYKLGHLIGFTKLTELHNKWIVDMLLTNDDKTLQAHRGSYKTTCVSIALAIIMILMPNDTTLFMRKTDTDIKEIVKQVKNILNSQQVRYFVKVIYGVDLKLTVDSATELNTNLATAIKGTSQLTAKGIGSSVTGKHYDRIFTDDIVNLSDRTSRAEREKTKAIYQELRNVINRGGVIFNTGTPWHKEDAFTLMPKAEKYDCYSTGLIDEKKLEEIKEGMTSSLFSANYELKHIASDDVIFANPQLNAEPYLVEQGEGHIDASYGGEDLTAYTLINLKDGKFYVYGKCWHKHIDDVEDEILKIHNEFNAGMISVEDNGDKGYLARDLRNKGARVHKYHESMNKFVKITSYLKSEWKNVIFVKGTDEEYIDQICDYNENAEHDDCPDSLSCLIRKLWSKKNKKERTFNNIW